MDSVYLYDKYGEPISHDLWREPGPRSSTGCAPTGAQPDEGIWEVRGGRQEFLYSRADVLGRRRSRRSGSAERRSFPCALDALVRHPRRDLPRHLHRLLGPEPQGVRAAPGSTTRRRRRPAHAAGQVHQPDRPALALDAARHRARTWSSDSLVYPLPARRRRADGLAGDEGTFSMCSFWYVRVPAAARRRRSKARFLLREDARLRQPPRPLRRGARAARRAPRQLPAGLHPPRR